MTIYRSTVTFFNIFFFTDSEVLYRTRDGDVVRLNVDTMERQVIVPNQLFVSTVCTESCKSTFYSDFTGSVSSANVFLFDFFSPAPAGQIQSSQIPIVSRHATCVVCI